ncbi:MAG: hypothetical protein L0956_05060 [Candidatus Mariimomonas ferrooxydans]
MNELVDTFNILKKKFHDYENRPRQIEISGEVFDCPKGKKRLLVEAGTGAGKSFAYLVPAILTNQKTIVSTASITLQDQLVNNNLVFLQKSRLFGTQKFSFAILKTKKTSCKKAVLVDSLSPVSRMRRSRRKGCLVNQI